MIMSKKFRTLLTVVVLFTSFSSLALAEKTEFDGLNMNMGNLHLLSKAKTRSISPENFTGEKGKGGMAIEGRGAHAASDLGQGWKVSPSIAIKSKETVTLAEIKGPGVIQSIWLTPKGNWRANIIRFYWDGEKTPSVECPVGDFFACGWGKFAQVSSLAVCVNPGSAFNCYWQMPFKKSCKITMENTAPADAILYYQINYSLTDIPENSAYFHAQYRRSNPLKFKDVHVILDDVKGWGHYVGTYMCLEARSPGWWGEGEIKFFMDGDKKFPTICGTGAEDYFCGSYGFHDPVTREYLTFTTPYAGMPQAIKPTPTQDFRGRFGLYRWHVTDPVRFEKDLKVTIQALGWQAGRKYLPLEDDIATVAYWYQTEPHTPFPKLPDTAISIYKK
jgi:hypothetical protein